MQDMLKIIIETDEKARLMTQEAEKEKLKSVEEIEALREKIYNDYINRAIARIEQNIAVDRELYGKRWQEYEKSIEAAKAKLQADFDANRDRWVDQIVSDVIG